MAYTPNFCSGEFHKPTGHYHIETDGTKILYAYIRKNGCTAFKKLINRNTHPKYKIKSILGLERNKKEHIEGNMKYYRVSRLDPECLADYDHVMFVYRDPVDRFISTYINKFIDQNGAEDIKNNYEFCTGKSFVSASMKDFVEYALKDFKDLDVHLWPQKSNLADVSYSTPVPLAGLQSTMSEIVGEAFAKKWFEKKENASGGRDGISCEDLTGVPADKLRKFREDGKSLSKENFLTDEVVQFVDQRYNCDKRMIFQIKKVEDTF